MSFGIYLHVPFCRRKCGYCDFYSVAPGPGLVEAYVEALAREISLRAEEAPPAPARTLYAGGGTPSLLSAGQWRRILDALREAFPLALEELTLEANPAGLGEAYLAELREMGFDRLSLGVQSFDDGELRLLGRRHDAGEARRAVRAARAAGFEEISLDLVYGIPGQGLESWERSIEAALALDPGHVSAYELTLSPDTPLGRRAARGEIPRPPADAVPAYYFLLVDRLAAAGLEAYEISNFARPGRACRHNLNYWRRGPYLGFGPAAHSFVGETRSANLPDLPAYLERLGRGERPGRSVERLTGEEARRERRMLALRLREGLPLSELDPQARARAAGIVEAGHGRVEGGRLRLGPSGAMLLNEIAVRLF